MATVHPYKGYLNTKFHLYNTNGTKEMSYQIFDANSDCNKPVKLGSFLPNIPHSFKMDGSGTFIVKFDDGTTSEIIVEDGYKFGGGKQKSAYIFDNTPWAFVIMHDRTYFYNRETDESYVEPISPDLIEELSKDYIILINNNQSERTIFSLQDQKPILNVSHIIYTNAEVVVWEQDNEIVFYSLTLREIRFRISNIIHYVIDKENKQLLCAYNEQITRINLFDNLDTAILYKWRGNFLAIINSSLSAYCTYSNNIAHLQIVNHVSNDIVKEFDIEGHIASVNNKVYIEVCQRKNAIKNFDIERLEFPEVNLEVVYHDIMFYPCEWDIYFVVNTTTISKSSCHFNSEESAILHSVNTDLSQKLKQYKSKVIITDTRFVLYNEFESFVRSKNYSAAGYNEGGEVYVHKERIIRSNDNAVYTLSRNGYWDNRVGCDYDFARFEKYGVIFDKTTEEYRSLMYNVKGKEIKYSPYPEEYVTLGNSIIYSGGKVLFDKSNFQTFSKKTLGISPNHNLGLDIRNHKVYLMSLENGNEICREILIGVFDSNNFQQVLLSENANQILYRSYDKTEIRDILTDQVFEFNNMSYVKQCNGIRPSFQSSSSLQPRIINPVTGQILDCELMKKYQFISPDVEYYADTIKDMYEEQYYLETKEIVDNIEFKKIIGSLTYPHKEKKGTQEWNEVTARRIMFVEKHFNYINKEFPKLTNETKIVGNWAKALIDEDDVFGVLSFVRRVIAVRGIAIIRRISDESEVAKIDLGLPLTYINYVSFSYDSRYVSLAGYRDFTHGLLLIYDLIEDKLLCRINTNRAVWTTAFSARQTIAAYTSDPNTIFFEDNFECVTKQDFDDNLILHRNYLTFSPDGQFIALSNQKYIPKYDINGNVNCGWGHQPSTFVEIRNTGEINSPLITFTDLSDCGIADVSRAKSVASVSFSNDNKHIMMVGNDGVVIIRNLHLDTYAIE